MIRFIIIVIFLGFYFILGLPLLFIEWVVRKCNKERADLHSLRIVQWAFGCMLFICGTDITYIGEENIPDAPVLYVANHRSMTDILVTYRRCKRLTGFVAKKSLLKAPILRVWMKRLYCLFLDRENPREGAKTIFTAIDQVKEGISIFIFPEGTRNKGEEGSLLPFHAGSFKIAERGHCAVIPVAISGTQAIWEAQFPKVRKVKVVVEYGKPIYMDEMDRTEKKKVNELCQQIIAEMLDKNKSLIS